MALALIWSVPAQAQESDLPMLSAPSTVEVPVEMPTEMPVEGASTVDDSEEALRGISESSGRVLPESSVDSSYILGPGDRLMLSFFNVPEYDGEKQILVDGTLSLPLVGKLPISGLTVEAASDAISSAYSSYLRTPLVSLELTALRPVQIGVSGEVNQPGTYEISLTSERVENAVEWPTVVEAIQLAGGITSRADIRQVEVWRDQGLGNVQIIRLNLWEMLTTGSIENDITLRYGDSIRIPTATALTPGELTQLSAANFSPDSIKVTVVGEVPQPGSIEIASNAPLNQALLAAGGFDPRRADVEEVELIRINPDGTVSQKVVPVAFDQGINEETNPVLRSNDVIVVNRSGRAAFSDSVNGILEPVAPLLSPVRLLLDLFD